MQVNDSAKNRDTMKISISRQKITLLFFFLLSISGFGQSISNWGLNQPQQPATLPKSKVAILQPVKKTKVKEESKLEQIALNDYLLKNGWEMAGSATVVSSKKSIFDTDFDTEDWHNATVPGTVLTTLVNQGVCPDPYFHMKNRHEPEQDRMEVIYAWMDQLSFRRKAGTGCPESETATSEYGSRYIFILPNKLKYPTLRLSHHCLCHPIQRWLQ